MRDEDLLMRAEYHATHKSATDGFNRILEMSIESARLKKKITEKGYDKVGIGGAIIELMGALVVQLAWVAAGAVFVGVVFGIACSEVPIVGTAGGFVLGAQLGAAIVGWFLTGIGVIEGTQMVGAVMGSASVPLQEGWNLSEKKGFEEQSADKFAEGWIEIGMVIIPIMLMIVMHKGGQGILKMSTNYPRLNSLLKALPKSLNNYSASKVAALSGYTNAEFQACKAMSMGRFILIRGCNPKRLRWLGKLLEGKSVEIKGKSIKAGPYEGAVALDEKDMVKAATRYNRTHLGNGQTRFNGAGELDGFTVETITIPGEPKPRYLLRDPDGEFVIPDMDRLAVMEFTSDGKAIGSPTAKNRLTQIAMQADDPNEIAWFNNMFNKLAGKNRANKNAAMHGYSSTFCDEMGMSRWNADKNEMLLLFSNGQAFEISWNDMVDFMRLNKAIGAPDVFVKVTK
ncbi:MAG: hypothetical protein ABIO39_02030 [Caulobacteraceae bacterium]